MTNKYGNYFIIHDKFKFYMKIRQEFIYKFICTLKKGNFNNNSVLYD